MAAPDRADQADRADRAEREADTGSGLEQAASLDTGNPSAGGGYALLIVVALGGVLLGVAAARTRVTNSR